LLLFIEITRRLFIDGFHDIVLTL